MSNVCKCLLSYAERKFRVDLLIVYETQLRQAKFKSSSYRL